MLGAGITSELSYHLWQLILALGWDFSWSVCMWLFYVAWLFSKQWLDSKDMWSKREQAEAFLPLRTSLSHTALTHPPCHRSPNPTQSQEERKILSTSPRSKEQGSGRAIRTRNTVVFSRKCNLPQVIKKGNILLLLKLNKWSLLSEKLQVKYHYTYRFIFLSYKHMTSNLFWNKFEY